MRRLTGAVCLLMLLPALLPAQAMMRQERNHKAGKLWKISVALLASASAADAVSSWNRHEGNPVLRGVNGQFGARGMALKSALVGGTLLCQHLFRRKDARAEKISTVVNFAATSAFATTAVRNYGLRSK